MSKKICVVTGTRAEYGLLSNLLNLIKTDHQLELQILVTGMHLSPEFGHTYKQIEEDGFRIDEKVEMLLSADTSTAVVKSMGLATIGFADALKRLEPDLLVILGDRFEMLAVAQSALIMGIPIAHIHGGECTFGAYDDAIRHSITKMASWHFTSTETYRQRVIQLGEHPSRVWNVGALGIDNIINLSLMNREEIFSELKLDLAKKLFLITYHPETNGDSSGIEVLLNVLKKYNHINLVFTKSNADNGGRHINKKISDFVMNHHNAYLFDSLGQLRYLSTVKHAELVIGNSSSGLIEVPYLNTPSINIGKRQAGRERPNSVFDTEAQYDQLEQAINNGLKFKGPYEKIYGDGTASLKIFQVLKDIDDYHIMKGFYDL